MIGALLFLVSSYSSSSDFDGVCRENQESNRRGFFFVSAAEEEEETPMEHIMETFSGTDSILQEAELDRFLHALQTGGKSEEEDAHAGHDDHEEEAHAHDDHEEEAHADHSASVSAKELLREYGALGDPSTSLTEAEFTSACPELLKCAVDAECAFEHAEEEHDEATKNPSKSYTKLKAGLAAAVFGESMFGWMIPMVSQAVAGRKARWVMSLLNAFSGGVFLSAGLTHLFPHLVEYQEQVKITPAGYPAGFCLLYTSPSPRDRG